MICSWYLVGWHLLHNNHLITEKEKHLKGINHCLIITQGKKRHHFLYEEKADFVLWEEKQLDDVDLDDLLEEEEQVDMEEGDVDLLYPK